MGKGNRGSLAAITGWTSGTPVGLLTGDVTTRLMGLFPLNLIPTFFVPLLLICHLISLRRVRAAWPAGRLLREEKT